MVPRLRIFLSSPGDVGAERLRAHLVIEKLARDYQRYFKIEPFLWEYEPQLASKHFQDLVDPPSRFDVVLLFVWSRLGTPLPEKTELREYRSIDGRAPVTGTEWEFEDALQANRARGGKGPPDLLVYRRQGGATASLENAEKRDEAIRQYEALEAFWQRWFKSGTHFLAGYTEYRELKEFDRRLESDLSKLIKRRIDEGHVDQASPLWLKGSPFRGLDAYEFDDAPVFFGRDGEKREGLARLAEAAERGTAFLMVSGASGSGKSSLARAGLLPSLVATKAVARVGLWRRVVMRPGDAGGDPILALTRALVSGDSAKGEGLAELAGKNITATELADHLSSGGNPAFLFTRTLRDLADTQRTKHGMLPHEQARLVLLVDQLEEIFTRPEIGAEQRSLFARALAALAGSGVVWVVVTMRSDLRHRVDEVKELRDLAERGARLALVAPDAAQLVEIIRQPAQAAGLKFDTDPGSGLALDAILAKEAEAQPGVLPLLSVMLNDLYDRDVAPGRTGGTLTLASYRALGGLREAIGQRAESKLESLRKTDRAAADALPRVLRALVTVGAAEDAPAARPVPLATFAESSPERRLVEVLLAADARLLTIEDRGKGPVVRLAHEALIENWPRAKIIVGEGGNFIRTRDEIDAQRRRWEAAKRPTELLLASGLPLADAEDLVDKFGTELSPEIRAFVGASRTRARRRQQLVVAAAVSLLVMAGGGVWWWDAHLRIKTEYCANYGERWGVPFCVGALDAATQAARHTSYRFRTRGGQVQDLTRVNGAGTSVDFRYFSYEDEPWAKGVARWQFSYRSDTSGTEPVLASVIMEGPTGVPLREVSYKFSKDRQAIAQFSRSFNVAERQAAEGSALGLSAFDKPSEQRQSGIGQHLLSFDAAGLLLRRDFAPLGGDSTMADALGSYGREYEYGDTGLPTRIRNLDGQGNTLVDKSGIAGQLHGYNARGDLATIEWLDGDGMPRPNQQNFARVVRSYSGVGNVIGEVFDTAAGALIERADLGVARMSAGYDTHGNMLDQAYFGADGNPVLRKDIGVARLTFHYDERGNTLEEAYFHADGKPILSKEGFARTTYRYDERGNEVELAYFGTDGKPVLNKTGVARTTYRYDERGNEVELAYFGTDGKPVLNKTGVARTTYRYDERGNEVELAYFGTDGKPVLNKSGFARVTYRYDERGNQIEWADFGADGKPVPNNNGVARETYRYDERGNKVEEAYFGTDGKPVLNKTGVARTTYRYDERGNEVELAYFGTDGKPVLNKNGVARTTYRYDERGNRIEWAGFGTDGNLVLDKDDGSARATYGYDERGNQVELAYLGTDGKPVLSKNHVARITNRYDERGNKVEEAYFGTDGKPILDKNGFARMTSRYDERGNRIEWAFFGIDGKPVLHEITGARMTFRYDERGNPIEWAFFGIDGKPVLNKSGYARVTYRYDERGNQIEWADFGTDGKPVPNNNGVARETYRYDERGNKVEEAYFGTDGKPVANRAGVARVSAEYDSENHIIKQSYEDERGQPVEQIGVKMRYSYNGANDVNGVAYLDEQDRIIPVEAEVRAMDPGSVAERIGLASGDRLLAYDGEPIKSREQFVAIVTHPEPGVHKLTVRHGDTITTREVPAGRLGVILLNVRAETKPEAPPSIGSTQRKRSQQRSQSNHYAR
jgi:hypothetical protein